MKTARILIVEDDAILINHLEQTLIQIGYQVSGLAATGETAVEMALAQKPDAILMDIRLRSAMTGIQAAAEIHRQLDTPIIYLTAYTDDELLQQAKLTDAYAYLAKPVRDRELRASLEMALYKHASEQRLQHLNQILRAVRDVNKLITHEPDTQRLLDQACQILLHAHSYQFVWIGQSVGDRLKPLAHAGDGQNLLTQIVASATPEQGMKLPGTEAARTRRVVVCHDMLHDERYAPWRAEIEQVHFASTVAIPISHEQSLFGVLSVYSDQTNIFGPEELDLLLELAGDIAFGLKAIERESERKRTEEELLKFKLGIERSADAIFMTDPQGVILYTNPAFERIYGYNQSDTIGQTPNILKSGIVSANIYQQFWMTLLNKEVVAGEIINKTKDGRLIAIEGSNNPILDTVGNIIGFLGMHRDVSERKQAERAIGESEERFRMLLQDVQSVSVQGYNMDGTTQYWNKASENLYGYSMQEAIGKNLIDLIIPADMKEAVRKAVSYMVESGQPSPAAELTLIKKDGSPVTVYSSHAIVKGSGGVPELFCIDIDLSARKQAEQAIRESEERFRVVVQTANDAVITLDNHGLIVSWNMAAETIFGFSADEALGMPVSRITPERFRAQQRYAADPTFENNERRLSGRIIEAAGLTKDGREFPFEMSLAEWKTQKDTFFTALIRDVSERKRAEKKLRESTERLQEAQRIALIGNWELDLENNNLTWSEQIYRIFEIDPVKFGASYPAFLDAIHPTDREAVDRAYTSSLETRNPYEIDHRLLMPDGRVKYVHERCETFYDVDGHPIRSVGTVQDITERQKAEQAIRESEQRFSTIFHASPIPILIIHVTDGKFVDVNGAFHNMSGYRREEVIGVSASELNQWVIPDDLRRLEMTLREQGTVHDFETRLRTKSGLIQDVLMSAAPIIVSGERYIVILAYDITARKQHEIELQAIARLSAALRTAPSRTEMLPAIVDELVALLNCETVAIEIIDPQTGDTVTEAAHGIWAALTGTRQKCGTGINTIISQTRKPYSTNDFQSDPNFIYPEWFNDIHGCIGAPLIAQDQLIGFAWMGRKSGIVEAEVRLFTAVADIAANALHRATLHEQSKKDAAELVLAYDSTLEGWAHALELRDQETEGHTRRVMQMTVELAKAMGVNEHELENVRRGALLHDIGKMGIPDSILLKPGTLNEAEWEIMRRHPEYAYNFLVSIDYLRPVLDIPYCHHEKWDGSGYPRGLKGVEIPFEARIFAIVDVWDALRSDRPYRTAWTNEKVRKHIVEQSGTHFDPQVVQAFLEFLERNNQNSND